MQYYGNRLSENISRREPEGYLLCLNVPVARTGTQDYLPEELGITPGSSSFPSGPGLISVYRPEEEVFAPETMASFEGMPVTNEHPPDGVDIENIRRVQMGHAHHIRRGTGDEADLLLADLIITDEVLIDAILHGKREISCGYTYELAEENGRYIQRKIRGNHIAVVEAGRAGHRVSIKDHQQVERSTVSMKKSLTKLLARMARDGDAETVAEFIEEMIEGESETKAEAVEEVAEAAAGAVAEAVSEGGNGSTNPGCAADEETLGGILERLDRLIELLTLEPGADEDPEKAESEEGSEISEEEMAEVVEEVIEAVSGEGSGEALSEEISGESAVEEVAEIIEAILEPDVSVTLEETSEGDEDPDNPEDICSNDMLRHALANSAVKFRKMSPRQRRKAAADIAEAAAQGDRSENFEYYAAKKFRGENESRIRYLERVLKTAVIISDESKEDEVGINNTVVLYDMDMQEEETLRIVTSMRGDILNGQISIESPIGKALMGHKVGDVITVKVDDGYSYQVEIRKIIKENDESADHIRSF